MKQHSILGGSLFIWIGCIAAISFMEAWLKFQAPGVTRAIGLSIGSLVFNALNKVELFLGGLILLLLWRQKARYAKFLLWLLLPLGLLLVQSFYLLPVLDERVEAILAQQPIEASWHHLYYVCIEIIKITALLIIGIQILNTHEYKH